MFLSPVRAQHGAPQPSALPLSCPASLFQALCDWYKSSDISKTLILDSHVLALSDTFPQSVYR